MSIPVPQDIPTWLRGAAEPAADTSDTLTLARTLRRAMSLTSTPRQAAVLVLFGGSPEADPDAPGGLPADAEVLLTQRAATMRQHRGQVAFPGGAVDPGDTGPIDTALREACEETGLDRSGVEPFAVLPKLFVPPSRFDVTPVVAYWRTPSEVGVVDESETERVVRVPVADLLDPANRFLVRGSLGYQSPAFQVDGMLVWGLTGGILAGIVKAAGWERDWDHHDVRDLETALADVGMTL
ncbi:NUDIX domain-containing protein [Nocardia tenerifensis]|uniref:NUDIX domain-containing protein n=1 Tax=Nocardia tenerifensis TaxID=228006 RepID=A0A318JYE5_9NOCA|nr:CoA pyrophosphatase [Nocardia tenerifensis]PXX63292.1 NUDIX domain-containing protein [Nocardia tenerifensis]